MCPIRRRARAFFKHQRSASSLAASQAIKTELETIKQIPVEKPTQKIQFDAFLLKFRQSPYLVPINQLWPTLSMSALFLNQMISEMSAQDLPGKTGPQTGEKLQVETLELCDQEWGELSEIKTTVSVENCSTVGMSGVDEEVFSISDSFISAELQI